MHPKSRLVHVFNLLLALILLAAASSAQSFPEIEKLLASDPASFTSFGGAVAVDGTTLAIGAKSAGSNSNGAVYIYTLDSGGAGTWSFVRKIPFPGSGFGVDFGASLGLSGDTLVVGAPFDDSIQGAAYVFERDQGGTDAWGQTRKLKPFDVDDGDLFGFAVAISGDTIVVGEFLDDFGLTSSGSAYIFERDAVNPNLWLNGPRLNASDLAFDDELGGAVAIDGDTVVVGASKKNGDTGAVYVFERDQGGASAWGQADKLTASDAASGDLFGRSVAIDGDTLVVGGPRNDDTCPADPNCNSGSAYVFARNPGGSTWSETRKLVAADAAQGDELGDAVAIDGDTVVAGARFDDPSGADSGAAYIFSRDQGGAGTWGELVKRTASDGAATDLFGAAVATGSGAVLVGAPNDSSSTGAAYVFGVATAPPPPPPPPPPPGTPTTILVPADMPTIGAAIGAALDGDIVQVAPGTYFENLSIVGKSITLRGEDCANTILDGSGQAILVVDAEDVEISCLVFRNGNPSSVKGAVRIEPSAAHATNGSAITIADCTFEGATGRNLYIHDPFCHGCTDRLFFERNTVLQAGGTNGYVGIGLLADDVSGAVVRDNAFLGFPFNPGPIYLMAFQASRDLVIDNNLFEGTNLGAMFNSGITAFTFGTRGNSNIAIVGNTFRQIPTQNSSAIYITDANSAVDNGAFLIEGNTFETATLNAVIHGTDMQRTAADLTIDLRFNNFLGISTAQERESLIHHQCTAAGGLYASQAGLSCQPFNGAFGDDSAYNLLVVEH